MKPVALLLKGEKVILRPPAWDDLPYIKKLWADPESMAEVGGPVILDEDRAGTWFARMTDPENRTDCYCLIFDKEGAPLGEVSFHRYDQDSKTAEFNIKIEHRRRFGGHGLEAMRLMLDFYFNQWGGESMEDPVAPSNVAGQRALVRFGFARVGANEDAVMLRIDKQRFNELYKKETGTCENCCH